MAIFKKNKMISILSFIYLFLFCALLLFSCSTTQLGSNPRQPAEKIKGASDLAEKEPSVAATKHNLKVPDFSPVKEDISPLQNKVVTISARNTPLRDVLYTIAETVSLNIVIERGVEPELPITMTLNNLTVEDALNIIFNSVDYFYSIKDNVLIVKAVGTKIFELGRPNVVQDYQTNIGGDILGGAALAGDTIKGDVTMKSASDKVSFQFWDALENSLKTLLPVSTGGEEMPSTGFTINRMAGTIMVTASKKDMEKVENYIDNLKKVLNRQVLIEARIVEVQLSEDLKYGIDWSLINNWRGVGNIEIKTEGFRSVVESTSPNFQVGITGGDFTSFLRALQEQGEVKTLSNPRINILNGQTAVLSVGRNTSFISRVETSTTTAEGATPITTFTTETKNVLSGIIFGLVPYISEEEKITLTITPIVSNLVELKSQTVGSGDNSVEIKLPTVDLREMSTTVKILDREMVIIGGLIDKKEALEENKVPILGDIPILGNLFKSVSKSYGKTELVIMLIPKIVNN